MNYSRRQLEALGEPLGESVTRLKPGGRIYGGGGSGGGGQASQQTTVQDLPSWAKPYAEQTLAKAQALTEQPYQTYDANRIAGFTPLQQTAQQGVANLQLPSTYGQAADITGAGISGLMGTAQQARGLYGLGNVAAGAGGRYAQQAQDFSGGPGSIGSYMNPYLSAALAPQIALQQQQQGIQANQLASQASQAGAFGGSRYGLQQGLQNQANQLALQNLMGQGYNQAYQQAQQAQQFGANLGLQGLQQAAGMYGQGLGAQQQAYGQTLGGASQLANIGGQGLQAQQNILGTQMQAGAQQQALQQQGLSQAYQDFLNQQNYPYRQLGFMSDILKGTPTGSSSTVNMYQGPGSMAGQLAGLGMGAYGMSRLMAEGGKVDSYAEGGEVEGYADRGLVEKNQTGQAIPDLSGMNKQQLLAAKQLAASRGDMAEVRAIDDELAIQASIDRGLGSAYNQLPQQVQDTYTAANGGIVAFAKGGDKGEEVVYQDPLGAPSYEVDTKALSRTFSPKQNIREGEEYTPGLRGMLFGYDVLPREEKKDAAKIATYLTTVQPPLVPPTTKPIQKPPGKLIRLLPLD